MKKQPEPKYSEGDVVKSSLNTEESLTVKGQPSWNGHTYMYAFREIDVRCGETYLHLDKQPAL